MLKKRLTLSWGVSLLAIGGVISSFLTLPGVVHAQVCAMCMVAIGSGLGISRLLGVDDALTGVWLGAAIVALASFVSNWVAKKWPQFKPGKWLTLGVVVIACLVGTYLMDGLVMYYPDTIVCDRDPCPSDAHYGLTNLSQGMIIGVIMLLVGMYTDKALRQLKNDGGKPYFPFQKVVVPFCFVLLGTLGAWLLVA